MDLNDALDNELSKACYRKVTKRLALQLAKLVASEKPADLAYAGLLIDRLEARVKYDHARLANQIDPRYHALTRHPF